MKKELKKFENYLIEEAKQYKGKMKELVKLCEKDDQINLLTQKEGSMANIVRENMANDRTGRYNHLLKNNCSHVERRDFNYIINHGIKSDTERIYTLLYKPAIEAYERYRQEMSEKNI